MPDIGIWPPGRPTREKNKYSRARPFEVSARLSRASSQHSADPTVLTSLLPRTMNSTASTKNLFVAKDLIPIVAAVLNGTGDVKDYDLAHQNNIIKQLVADSNRTYEIRRDPKGKEGFRALLSVGDAWLKRVSAHVVLAACRRTVAVPFVHIGVQLL